MGKTIAKNSLLEITFEYMTMKEYLVSTTLMKSLSI